MYDYICVFLYKLSGEYISGHRDHLIGTTKLNIRTYTVK